MHIFEHIDKKVVIGFGVALLILLSVFSYYGFSGTTSSVEAPPLSVLSASPLDASLGRELLAALAKLKSTKLDTSIFNDPIYISLKDFGVEIAAQPVGRRNPFAELGASDFSGPSGVVLPTGPSSGGTVDSSKPPSKAPSNGGGFDID